MQPPNLMVLRSKDPVYATGNKRCLRIWSVLIAEFYRIFVEENYCTMELTMTSPVSFTAEAVTEIKRLMNAEGFDATHQLRIGVKGGGCSGLTYVLGFDQKEEADEAHEFQGLPFIMNKSHGIYLMGMEIDWQDGLNSRGFVFNNPNASKTCGCGTSFSV